MVALNAVNEVILMVQSISLFSLLQRGCKRHERLRFERISFVQLIHLILKARGCLVDLAVIVELYSAYLLCY